MRPERDHAEKTLVSVIMIFWNTERFLDEAVESVLAQSHPSLELLLCDDGSTDGSTAGAEEWARRVPGKVRYLQHPGHAHEGMSSTRNLGLAAARGELVAFLDADDVWAPGHLEHEVRLLAAHPEAAAVCGQAVEWHSWADPRAVDEPASLPWPAGTVIEPPRMLSAVLRNGSFAVPTCNLLVRRRVLAEIGGWDVRFRDMFEDQVMLAKLYLSYTCVISGTRTAYYRQHPESATALAVRRGDYNPTRPNPRRAAFLRSISELPQVRSMPESAEVRVLLRDELEPYEQAQSRIRLRAGRALRSRVSPEMRRRVRTVADRVGSRAPLRFGSFRRLAPFSGSGATGGRGIDGHFIERFLAANAHVIEGRVLLAGGSREMLGLAESAASRSGSETAAIALGDITSPPGGFDCILALHSLPYVYDLRAALEALRAALRPGGTLLATLPGIGPLRAEPDAPMYWPMAPAAARRLFGEVFGPDNVDVGWHGNVLTSIAFLEGVAADDLRLRELDHVDPAYPTVITVRAQLPMETES